MLLDHTVQSPTVPTLKVPQSVVPCSLTRTNHSVCAGRCTNNDRSAEDMHRVGHQPPRQTTAAPSHPHIHACTERQSRPTRLRRIRMCLRSVNCYKLQPRRAPVRELMICGDCCTCCANTQSLGTTECGVDLQGPSTVEASRTKRYDGLVLQLTITYQNVYHWRGPEKKIAYEYSVELIPGSKSKVLQQIFVHYPDQVQLRLEWVCKQKLY